MNKSVFKYVLPLLFSLATVANGGTYVGAGYTVPTPITIAPGEIITLYVQGIGAGITAPVASVAYPLPTTLAGISVNMTQMLAPVGPIGVPILSIFPANTCSTAGVANCLDYVGITVQIPHELVSNLGPGPGYITNQAFLTVTENGVSTVIQVSAMYDQIHILRQQDTIFTLGVPATSENFPLVTHADGSLVTPDNLAIVGETLVIYAVGLGFTSPQVATGAQSPSPAATVASAVAFDFNDNAGPGWPFAPGIPVGGGSGYPSAPPQNVPTFAGLVPGFAGLYQINFVVPPLPASYDVLCPQVADSNLTVSVVGFTSFDGVGLCVALK